MTRQFFHGPQMLAGFSVACATTIFLAMIGPAVAQDATLVEAAKKEGKVVVYSTTDSSISRGLLGAFTKKYGIEAVQSDQSSNGLYNLVISEGAAGQVASDVVWSSAMDLQLTLAAEGHAEEYASSEARNLPAWANYKNLAYGTTLEPIVTIYNTSQIKPEDMPKTYTDLVKFLNDKKEKLNGKVASTDPEKSGGAFMYHKNDERNRQDYWDLVGGLGVNSVKLFTSSGTINEAVISGEVALAYDVIGSYALELEKRTPNVKTHFYQDYTPAFSRVAFISKGAPHPNAGRLFLDFMLSKEGQTELAKAGLPSIRGDVESGLDLDGLQALTGPGLKPIALDDTLLENTEEGTRQDFYTEWRKALGR